MERYRWVEGGVRDPEMEGAGSGQQGVPADHRACPTPRQMPVCCCSATGPPGGQMVRYPQTLAQGWCVAIFAGVAIFAISAIFALVLLLCGYILLRGLGVRCADARLPGPQERAFQPFLGPLGHVMHPPSSAPLQSRNRGDDCRALRLTHHCGAPPSYPTAKWPYIPPAKPRVSPAPGAVPIWRLWSQFGWLLLPQFR